MIIRIDDDKLELFSKRLKTLRLENGFTQKELATASGIGFQTIQRLETQKAKQIRDFELERLAFSLKCTQDYLLGNSSEPLLNSKNLTVVASINPEFKENKVISAYREKPNKEYFDTLIEFLHLANDTDKATLLSTMKVFLEKAEYDSRIKKGYSSN